MCLVLSFKDREKEKKDRETEKHIHRETEMHRETEFTESHWDKETGAQIKTETKI
jgi:hypothetical protein